MTTRNHTELLKRYMLIFGESFPTEMAPPDEEEQMNIIEKCLESKTPYDPTTEPWFDPEAVY